MGIVVMTKWHLKLRYQLPSLAGGSRSAGLLQNKHSVARALCKPSLDTPAINGFSLPHPPPSTKADNASRKCSRVKSGQVPQRQLIGTGSSENTSSTSNKRGDGRQSARFGFQSGLPFNWGNSEI